jgi:hypothetical protein
MWFYDWHRSYHMPTLDTTLNHYITFFPKIRLIYTSKKITQRQTAERPHDSVANHISTKLNEQRLVRATWILAVTLLVQLHTWKRASLNQWTHFRSMHSQCHTVGYTDSWIYVISLKSEFPSLRAQYLQWKKETFQEYHFGRISDAIRVSASLIKTGWLVQTH